MPSYMMADAVKAIFGNKNPWPLAGKILKYFDNETEALFYLARLNFRVTFQGSVEGIKQGVVHHLAPLETHGDRIKYLEWMRQNKQLTPTPPSQGGDDIPWGKTIEEYYRMICPKGKAAGAGFTSLKDIMDRKEELGI